MLIYDRIRSNLNEQLTITKLEVVDDSSSHMGHAGYQEGGETHFNIIVVSPDFQGKSKVMRHKMIYKALEKEMTDRIHALSIVAKTPSESK